MARPADRGGSDARARPAGRLERARALARRGRRGRGPERTAIVLLALALGIVVTTLVSLNLGFLRIPPLEVLRTLLGAGDAQSALVLLEFRLPRIALAVLVGAGLALSGAILQGVSGNGLADPGILGINAGAGLAVVGLLFLAQTTGARGASPFLLPLAAFLGAAGAAALVYGLALQGGRITPGRLLLVGVAVNAGLAAAMLVISLRMDQQLYAYAVAWLEGTVANTSWRQVLALLPWTLALTPLALRSARTLDVVALGDEVATGLGAAVDRQRLLLVGLAVALAGSAVAVAGGVGFLGLVGPHLARRLVGPGHRAMLPVAALSGALLLLAADALARNAFAPVEIPVGIVVAAIGAPYFLLLLARARD